MLHLSDSSWRNLGLTWLERVFPDNAGWPPYFKSITLIISAESLLSHHMTYQGFQGLGCGRLCVWGAFCLPHFVCGVYSAYHTAKTTMFSWLMGPRGWELWTVCSPLGTVSPADSVIGSPFFCEWMCPWPLLLSLLIAYASDVHIYFCHSAACHFLILSFFLPTLLILYSSEVCFL